jgi:hypothetical protein
MAECLEGLLALMKKNIDEAAADNDNECATLDLRDKWRAEDFYVQATDAVYRKHEKRLKKLYDSKIDYQDVGTHNFWTLKYWKDLMEECNFHEDESFTRAEGNLCFYFSKFEVVDYQKNAMTYESLDWLSFLEAIGHIVRFKEMPKLEHLVSFAGVEDVVELVEQLDAEGASWNDFMGRYGEAGLAEGDDDVDPFHVRLDELIKLLFHMRTKAAQKQKVAAKAAAEGE